MARVHGTGLADLKAHLHEVDNSPARCQGLDIVEILWRLQAGNHFNGFEAWGFCGVAA